VTFAIVNDRHFGDARSVRGWPATLQAPNGGSLDVMLCARAEQRPHIDIGPRRQRAPRCAAQRRVGQQLTPHAASACGSADHAHAPRRVTGRASESWLRCGETDYVGNARVLTREEVDFAVKFGHRQPPASWPVHFIEGLHFLERADGKG
jgi:hypothetical protein